MPKDNLADDRDQEQVLKGIQPRHQVCYKAFKSMRLIGILGLIVAGLLFALTFVQVFNMLTANSLYRKFVLIVAGASIISIGLAVIDKLLFLRKAPFDDWVFEIAEKRLGTSVIFYDGRNIYIQYDRGGKEVDKREFVSEMSDKSIHYSYYYVKTFIDQGVIMVNCKKRQPIPDKASFSPNDDKFWNIVPMGLTINPRTMAVSPIGWYLNDQNKNDELYETVPSTSILICGMFTKVHNMNNSAAYYSDIVVKTP